MSRNENSVVNSIDYKARLEKATSKEELMAVLVSAGLLPPNDEMTLKKARSICKETYRTLAGINFLAQMYTESLKDTSLSQTASAFPYVLKKEPEEANINIFDLDPLEGMSEEERDALKKFTVSTMRKRIGMSDGTDTSDGGDGETESE